MNDKSQFSGDYQRLAEWLQQLMQMPSPQRNTGTELHITQLELVYDSHYHSGFYQQLPDFIMALLKHDEQAPLRYAPLLYHLAGCTECHSAYLDLYDAMRAAIDPQEPPPLLGQGTRTLDATPHRMLAHLCQVLISQADALLLQARRTHSESDAAARSLLQQALRVSAHIGQSALRRQALHDLVRVATQTEGGGIGGPDEPHTHVYTPSLANSGGARRAGKRVLRRLDTPLRSADMTQEPPVIYVQSRELEGSITQRGETLELQLQELEQTLRGHRIIVKVPLGSLVEPVRWRGGNPLAIVSRELVDQNGSITVPLGETDLRLTNNEERNLLEAMFMLLEVRVADSTEPLR